MTVFLLGGLASGPAWANQDDALVVDPAAHPVVIGIPDTGINPYHEMFYRPGLTAHPSTYIEGYPADVPALPLSVGGSDWNAMFDADVDLWEGIEEDRWYWIPETVFVAVYCESGQRSSHRGQYCILDDGHWHGTGTASSALMENPGALIAFKAGGSSIRPFMDDRMPVDLFSVSWGSLVPVPGHPELVCLGHQRAPLYVVSAGNDPRSLWTDCSKGDPALITVGGAYPEGTEETFAAKQAELVSYYCRPVAASNVVSGLSGACGTSFAAPTVAGGLSKVIQAVRADSGYTGGRVGDMLDPVAGFTVHDLRSAMNRTASYDPEAIYDVGRSGLPLNPVAPWLQWGWGFYDGRVADATIEHLLGRAATAKPLGAIAYMTASHGLKTGLYGRVGPGVAVIQDDAGTGRDAPDRPVPDITIEPGVVYLGTVDGLGDTRDHYAFYATAGDQLHVRGYGGINTFSLFDANGHIIAHQATTAGDGLHVEASLDATTETTGVHYLRAYGPHPARYAFGLGVNEEAPGLGDAPKP